MQKGHRRLAVFRLGALTGSLLTHLWSIDDEKLFVIPFLKTRIFFWIRDFSGARFIFGTGHFA